MPYRRAPILDSRGGGGRGRSARVLTCILCATPVRVKAVAKDLRASWMLAARESVTTRSMSLVGTYKPAGQYGRCAGQCRTWQMEGSAARAVHG